VVHNPWAHVLKATVIPSISFNPDYLMALIAVLGTTNSPYSFFGQTSTFVWRASLESKPHRAGKFYTVIAV